MDRAPVQVDGDGAEVVVLLQRELGLVQFLRLRVFDLQYECLCRHTPRTVRVTPGCLVVHYGQPAANTGRRTPDAGRRTPDAGHMRALTGVRSVQEFRLMALAHI